MAIDTAHFRVREFRCSHCGAGDTIISQELLNALEKLRALWDRPMSIGSGYRCSIHNASVGGAKRSAHLEGKAADVVDPGNVLDTFLSDQVLEQCGLWREDPKATPGWVHLQVRPLPGPRTFKK